MQYINTKRRQKTARLVLAMAAMSLLPMGTFVQEGLFQRGITDESYYDFSEGKENSSFLVHRSLETTGTINNQVFGQSVPILAASLPNRQKVSLYIFTSWVMQLRQKHLLKAVPQDVR